MSSRCHAGYGAQMLHGLSNLCWSQKTSRRHVHNGFNTMLHNHQCMYAHWVISGSCGRCMHAGVGLWLVVMGGRTADVGWFRTKTDTFLNDTCVMDRYFCRRMNSFMATQHYTRCTCNLITLHCLLVFLLTRTSVNCHLSLWDASSLGIV